MWTHPRAELARESLPQLSFEPLAETELDDWRKAFDVDLIGSFMLTRAMLRRGRSGAIVNDAQGLFFDDGGGAAEDCR